MKISRETALRASWFAVTIGTILCASGWWDFLFSRELTRFEVVEKHFVEYIVGVVLFAVGHFSINWIGNE